MNQLPLFSQSKSVRDFYQPDAEIILYQGDSNNFIKTIPDNSSGNPNQNYARIP